MSPELKRICWLGIEMSIDHHRGFPLGMQPFSVDDRMPPCGQNLNFLQPRALEPLGRPFGGSLYILGVLWKGRDAGDTQKVEELLEEAIKVLLKIIFPLAHRASPSLGFDNTGRL